MPELRECLDPARSEEMTLSEAAETEIILAGKECDSDSTDESL